MSLKDGAVIGPAELAAGFLCRLPQPPHGQLSGELEQDGSSTRLLEVLSSIPAPPQLLGITGAFLGSALPWEQHVGTASPPGPRSLPKVMLWGCFPKRHHPYYLQTWLQGRGCPCCSWVLTSLSCPLPSTGHPGSGAARLPSRCSPGSTGKSCPRPKCLCVPFPARELIQGLVRWFQWLDDS